MNIQLSVYYSIDNIVQESVQVDLDDEWVEWILMHYLKQNKGSCAELEDFVINGICVD